MKGAGNDDVLDIQVQKTVHLPFLALFRFFLFSVVIACYTKSSHDMFIFILSFNRRHLLTKKWPLLYLLFLHSELTKQLLASSVCTWVHWQDFLCRIHFSSPVCIQDIKWFLLAFCFGLMPFCVRWFVWPVCVPSTVTIHNTRLLWRCCCSCCWRAIFHNSQLCLLPSDWLASSHSSSYIGTS